MMYIPVNIFAVLASGIAFMAIGAFWYSPAAFGKQWQKLVGLKPSDIKQSEMGKIYGSSFVASMVLAYILGYLLNALNLNTVLQGVEFAILVWFGFVSTTYGIN